MLLLLLLLLSLLLLLLLLLLLIPSFFSSFLFFTISNIFGVGTFVIRLVRNSLTFTLFAVQWLNEGGIKKE